MYNHYRTLRLPKRAKKLNYTDEFLLLKTKTKKQKIVFLPRKRARDGTVPAVKRVFSLDFPAYSQHTKRHDTVDRRRTWKCWRKAVFGSSHLKKKNNSSIQTRRCVRTRVSTPNLKNFPPFSIFTGFLSAGTRQARKTTTTTVLYCFIRTFSSGGGGGARFSDLSGPIPVEIRGDRSAAATGGKRLARARAS